MAMGIETGSMARMRLEKAWGAACRVILGGEVGQLEDYADWLMDGMEPIYLRRSSLSGNEVAYAVPDYAADAKWASFEEINGRKFEPLSINDVKDIDSVIEAVRERMYYAGNVVLGNSSEVVQSSNVANSNFVLASNFISDSKNIAYSSFVRYSENLFGANNDTTSNFAIRGLDTYGNRRILEGWGTYNCSDTAFTFGCEDCRQAMFSFNIKGKSHVIGNLQLTQDKYAAIRETLLAEMRQELKANRRLPSLAEITGGGARFGDGYENEVETIRRKIAPAAERTDRKPIENAFRQACKVVLGEPLDGFDEYGPWLMRHGRDVRECDSAISGRKTYVAEIIPYRWMPADRMITREESLLAGELMRISENGAEKLSLGNASEMLGGLAGFIGEMRLKKSINLMQTAIGFSAQHCYRGGLYALTKYSAFTYWPRDSQYTFGCNTIFSSSFCIKSYYSNNLARCFEADSCRSCSDSYFVHNCENVQNALFCSNVKNVSYAIGNAVVGREKFLEAKSAFQKWVLEKLQKDKALEIDIFNLGASRAVL